MMFPVGWGGHSCSSFGQRQLEVEPAPAAGGGGSVQVLVATEAEGDSRHIKRERQSSKEGPDVVSPVGCM